MEIKVHGIVMEDDRLDGTLSQNWKGRSFLVAPIFKSRNDNPTWSGGAANVIGGTNSVQVDGDLWIDCSWSYGFLIFRIADDGTMTELDRTSVFGSNNQFNLCLDRVRKKAYVSARYGINNGVQEYDYSAWVSGGAGPTVTGTLFTTSNSNLGYQGSGWGYPYWGGTYMCGDWIYFNRYNNSGAGTFVQRWNPSSDTWEEIAVTNGTGTIYNGGFTYDPVEDRLYQCGLSGNGGIWCVTDPSSASPGVYSIYLRTATGNYGSYPDIYTDGDVIVLQSYAPGYNIHKLDISTPLSGASNEPDNVWSSPEYNLHSNYGYSGFMGFSKPVGLDIAVLKSDRGYAVASGWVDLDNGILVASNTTSTTSPTQSENILDVDYGYRFKLITSDGGTPTTYWVWWGYSSRDGANWHVFTEDKGPRLENSWDVTFGPWQLDSTANVKSAMIVVDGATTPASCTLDIYARNDGVNWQAITPGISFDFVTTGNEVELKIVGTGTDLKSSYVKSDNGPLIALFDELVAYSLPLRRTTMRLAGRQAT